MLVDLPVLAPAPSCYELLARRGGLARRGAGTAWREARARGARRETSFNFNYTGTRFWPLRAAARSTHERGGTGHRTMVETRVVHEYQ